MLPISNTQFNRQIFLIIGFLVCLVIESVGYLLNKINLDEVHPVGLAIHLIGMIFYLPVLLFLQKLLSEKHALKRLFHWIIATEILYIPSLFITNNDNGTMQLYAMVIFFAMFFSYFVVCIRLLNGQYVTHPLIKPLRPFAIAMIIGMILNFTIGFIAAVEASPAGTGIAYLVGSIPYVFLITYFKKIKKIYPDILNGNYKIHDDIDENWPPEKHE